MSCLLCEGQKIPAEGFSKKGMHTMKQNMDFLFGTSEKLEPSDYIQLVEDENETYLSFQNSSGEYADGFIAIRYCPLCGKKLKAIEKE